MAWWEHKDSARLADRMRRCLERWANSDRKAETYDYKGHFPMYIHYCADRMNAGRAKGLLRLMDEYNATRVDG